MTSSSYCKYAFACLLKRYNNLINIAKATMPYLICQREIGTNIIAYNSCDVFSSTNNFPLANKTEHDGFDNVYKRYSNIAANGSIFYALCFKMFALRKNYSQLLSSTIFF
uniref:Uncharacterized protein n=1 Tax=Solanum lycopersicum TaxID=4081 RepID=A0A3Q7FM79_SOLLC